MIGRQLQKVKKAWLLIGKGEKETKCYLDNWENSLKDTGLYYVQAYRYFKLYLDKKLVAHRSYFQAEKRGFGEDAFHVMWQLIYSRYDITNFLEIGVYRGQVMSMVAYLAHLSNKPISITGISPFNKSGDEVSNYLDIDYIDDINQNFAFFLLQPPNLFSAYSTAKEAIDLIDSKPWDCIYIDGSHDYDIVLEDWQNCSRNVKVGGLVVFDDASLYTDYNNPFFAFKGHPGPSKVADEVDNGRFKEILRMGHNRVFQRLI